MLPIQGAENWSHVLPLRACMPQQKTPHRTTKTRAAKYKQRQKNPSVHKTTSRKHKARRNETRHSVVAKCMAGFAYDMLFGAGCAQLWLPPFPIRGALGVRRGRLRSLIWALPFSGSQFSPLCSEKAGSWCPRALPAWTSCGSLQAADRDSQGGQVVGSESQWPLSWGSMEKVVLEGVAWEHCSELTLQPGHLSGGSCHAFCNSLEPWVFSSANSYSKPAALQAITCTNP